MSLTDTAIRNAKAQEKDYKLFDEKGMYLLVLKSGNKYFRLDYRFAGKRKTLALGVYPEISLKEAREKRDEAKKLISEGKDPSEIKKAKKYNIYSDTNNSLETIAQEWFDTNKLKWIESHAKSKWRRLEKHILPYLGSRPIKNITTQELLSVVRMMESRGNMEMAHRTKNIVGEIFAFAIATDRADRNIALDLKGALTPVISKNMATITNPAEVGALLRAIDSYVGDFVTKCALKLTPYVMLRPGELRNAEWSEIDFEKKLWKIHAKKMKMRRDHIVPLSPQVIAIFEEIRPVTGQWRYIFPSVRTKDRPMSNVTVLAALRRMGYTKDEMTAHGFRAMASTLLHENGFDTAHIEVQLAHAERNKVKAAYNHAEYLPQRTEMMTWWANFLDKLRDGI
ncbi:MAG: tyrosine-type recombinase/integrase [Deferribacteraceae bacterium]|jgi:integrase|nr:tyrosine-type recombinase/integrase [Deferribacteraceae bacterium]